MSARAAASILDCNVTRSGQLADGHAITVGIRRLFETIRKHLLLSVATINV